MALSNTGHWKINISTLNSKVIHRPHLLLSFSISYLQKTPNSELVRLISIWHVWNFTLLLNWWFPLKLLTDPFPLLCAWRLSLPSQPFSQGHTFCTCPWCTRFFPSSFQQLLLPFFCSSHPKPVQPAWALQRRAAGVPHCRDRRAALSCCCLQVCTGTCKHSFPAGRLGPYPLISDWFNTTLSRIWQRRSTSFSPVAGPEARCSEGMKYSCGMGWEPSVWVHCVSTICSQKLWVPESLVGFWWVFFLDFGGVFFKLEVNLRGGQVNHWDGHSCMTQQPVWLYQMWDPSLQISTKLLYSRKCCLL